MNLYSYLCAIMELCTVLSFSLIFDFVPNALCQFGFSETAFVKLFIYLNVNIPSFQSLGEPRN